MAKLKALRKHCLCRTSLAGGGIRGCGGICQSYKLCQSVVDAVKARLVMNLGGLGDFAKVISFAKVEWIACNSSLMKVFALKGDFAKVISFAKV